MQTCTVFGDFLGWVGEGWGWYCRFLYADVHFHYLRQNKLPMKPSHEMPEEAQELILTHIPSQKHQEEVTL